MYLHFVFAFQWSPLILNPSYTILHFLGATKVDFISMHFALAGHRYFRMVPNRMICNYQTYIILHSDSETFEYCFDEAHA